MVCQECCEVVDELHECHNCSTMGPYLCDECVHSHLCEHCLRTICGSCEHTCAVCDDRVCELHCVCVDGSDVCVDCNESKQSN